jgi:predicted nucleic acid-binding protein
MTESESALLDANVLVYAFDRESPHYASARSLLEWAAEPDAGLCVVPQVLAEFYAVVTSPRRVEHPKTPVEVLGLFEELRALPGLALRDVPADLVDRWTALVRRRPVAGPCIFDLVLVGTMLGPMPVA